MNDASTDCRGGRRATATQIRLMRRATANRRQDGGEGRRWVGRRRWRWRNACDGDGGGVDLAEGWTRGGRGGGGWGVGGGRGINGFVGEKGSEIAGGGAQVARRLTGMGALCGEVGVWLRKVGDSRRSGGGAGGGAARRGSGRRGKGARGGGGAVMCGGKEEAWKETDRFSAR